MVLELLAVALALFPLPPPSKTACVKVEDDHTGNHATTEKAGNRDADMILRCHLAGKKGHTAVDCQSLSVPNAGHQAQRQDYSSLKRARDGLTHLIKDSHRQATPQQAQQLLFCRYPGCPLPRILTLRR